MKELYTDVEIEAPAEKVWQILTDFAHFSEWNPFIRSIEGKPESGSRLRVQLHPPGARAMTFRPKVLRAEPREELRWKGRFILPGLFDGQHTFKIQPLGPHRVRFIQREKFTGVLTPFLARSLETTTKQGFKQMNEALKARSEIAARSSS
jgi:hypothetical protein